VLINYPPTVNRTPLVDIDDKETKHCITCSGPVEDVFALTLKLTDETGSLKAVVYGADAVRVPASYPQL
jgi:hypothetical protein